MGDMADWQIENMLIPDDWEDREIQQEWRDREVLLRKRLGGSNERHTGSKIRNKVMDKPRRATQEIRRGHGKRQEIHLLATGTDRGPQHRG